jgi:hypothetical protein
LRSAHLRGRQRRRYRQYGRHPDCDRPLRGARRRHRGGHRRRHLRHRADRAEEPHLPPRDAPTIIENTTDHSKYRPAFTGYPFRFASDPAVTGTGPSLSGLPEAMVSAYEAEDVGIFGDGTIDGSGTEPAAAATPDNPNALSCWQLAANAKSLTSHPASPAATWRRRRCSGTDRKRKERGRDARAPWLVMG